MQWVRRVACFFGFHQFVPIREEWFLYRQKQLYLENQDYLKHGENIVTVVWCPNCRKRIEIKVNS